MGKRNRTNVVDLPPEEVLRRKRQRERQLEARGLGIGIGSEKRPSKVERSKAQKGFYKRGKFQDSNAPRVRNRRKKTNEKQKLSGLPLVILSGLPFTMDEKGCKDLLVSRLGLDMVRFIVRVQIAKNHEGKSRGVGFVTFSSQDYAERARSALEGEKAEGRVLGARVGVNRS